MINIIKNAISKLKRSGEEEDAAPRYPRRFMAVRWREGARKLGVGGRQNKKIATVRNGKVKGGYTIPYHSEIVKALRDELNMPVLDETGGQESPRHDELREYDPGVLAWNQAELQNTKRR